MLGWVCFFCNLKNIRPFIGNNSMKALNGTIGNQTVSFYLRIYNFNKSI